jgi:hypothetical protein
MVLCVTPSVSDRGYGHCLQRCGKMLGLGVGLGLGLGLGLVREGTRPEADSWITVCLLQENMFEIKTHP